MKKLKPLLFIGVTLLVLAFICGMIGPHMNIKQAIAVEIIYLITAMVFGWNTAEYKEDLAKTISAFGGLAMGIILQVVAFVVYWLYHWIMS